jgi:hypothetical protein
MSQEQTAEVTLIVVADDTRLVGNWKICARLSDTIDVRDSAGKLLASFSLNEAIRAIGGLPEPKPPTSSEPPGDTVKSKKDTQPAAPAASTWRDFALWRYTRELEQERSAVRRWLRRRTLDGLI